MNILPPQKFKNIVILTGAGISAESGIQTFRATDGLWENHRIEDVATPEGFRRDPGLVYQFYNERRRKLLDPKVLPNSAHLALAELEKNFSGNVSIITQNVDDLHERSGSKNLIHMHGELFKVRCKNTGMIFDHKSDLDQETICSCCNKKNNLRPHIVWFNEMPLFMDKIEFELSYADLFIAVGTSGNVYPAAQFVSIAKKRNQAYCIEINPQSTLIQNQFDKLIRENASIALPNLVKEILSY
jgi:NAD-dependent deacetylase